MNVIQVVLLLTGACMIFAPRALTKMQDREKPEALKKTKDMGVWLFLAGVIWLVADYVIKMFS
ncbi:MAG: permease [Lachnospiraceae bacterium]|nr:permease [Lachnospiraceae bacterium]